MPTLCPPCQELYDGWLTTPRPITRWVTLNNPQRSIEDRRAKAQDERKLVRQQLDGIRKSCLNKHQTKDES